MGKQYINTGLGERGGARFRVNLDGRFYTLQLFWLETEDVWTLAIFDADNKLLRSGLHLRHGEDVLAPFPAAVFPGAGLGRLKPWDITGNQRDPGRGDLRRDSGVQLVYSTRAAVLASGAS